MKIIELTFLIFAWASLSNQCARDGVVNRESISSPSPSADYVRPRQTMQGEVDIIQNAIKRESLKLKIGNLKDTASTGGKEIRIWTGFGIIVPRIFIYRELNGKQEAFFITAKPSGKRGKIAMPQLSLRPPASGWNEFAEFMTSHGIDSPMKLSLDEQYAPDPDEEAIAMEMKSHGKYELVFYTITTKSENGQKALAVCRRIEQEFGVSMGCGAR
jgi:hypothetical protein